MAKRPAYTLLFIKSDLVARADFGPAPNLVSLGFWQQSQTANVRLYHSMEVAMGLGGKCGRTVWVIGEAFWTQTLALPATALSGLAPEQIAKAIGFDVEALTGLSGMDSSLGFCKAAPPDASEHLWVTQVPATSRTQIQSAVESAGSALGGILHPGGIPEPLDAGFNAAPSLTTWRRIEVWKDTTLCLIGRGGESQRLSIINGDPAQDAWRSNLTRWINASPAEHSEWFGPQGSMAGESLHGDARPWAILPALTGEALSAWLGRWASTLASGAGAAPAPIVEPSRANTAQRRQLATVAAVVLACIVGCALRGLWLGNQHTQRIGERDALAAQLAGKALKLNAIEAPGKQWDRLQKEIKSLRMDLQARRSERIRGAHDVPDFELQRHRVAELLAALARSATPDLMIDHIAAEGAGDMSIEGKSLPNASVDAFADALAAALPAAGWRISAAQRKPSGPIPGGQFSLRVTPLPQHAVPDEPDEIIPSASLAGGVK